MNARGEGGRRERERAMEGKYTCRESARHSPRCMHTGASQGIDAVSPAALR